MKRIKATCQRWLQKITGSPISDAGNEVLCRLPLPPAELDLTVEAYLISVENMAAAANRAAALIHSYIAESKDLHAERDELKAKLTAELQKYSDAVEAIVCMRLRAEKAEADRDEFKKKLTAMHRRCQRAEAALPAWDKIKAKSNGTVKSIGRALLIATIQKLEAERDALLKLTESLDEHPDDYDGPCWCRTCQSYAADNHDPNA